MHRGRLFTLLGSCLMIIGAFLPWAYIFTLEGPVTELGLHRLGRLAGLWGLFLLTFAALTEGEPGYRYSSFAIAAALFVVAVAVKHIFDLAPAVITYQHSASVGVGVYVVIAGAVVAAWGGLQRTPCSFSDQERFNH